MPWLLIFYQIWFITYIPFLFPYICTCICYIFYAYYHYYLLNHLSEIADIVPYHPQIFHSLFPLLSHKYNIIIQRGSQHPTHRPHLHHSNYPNNVSFFWSVLAPIQYYIQILVVMFLKSLLNLSLSHDSWVLLITGLSICKMLFNLDFFIVSAWVSAGMW